MTKPQVTLEIRRKDDGQIVQFIASQDGAWTVTFETHRDIDGRWHEVHRLLGALAIALRDGIYASGDDG